MANSGANNVQVFPGVGGGFFNDQPQATRTYAVGQAPSSLFLGNFNGLGQGLATLNSGSNNGTLITGIGSANPVTQSFPTGGDSPTAGFAGDFTGNGFTDLVVGNNGDGQLALLMGGPGGLSLSQTLSSAEVPNPTALSFGGVSDGLLELLRQHGRSRGGHESGLQPRRGRGVGAWRSGLDVRGVAVGGHTNRGLIADGVLVAGDQRRGAAGNFALEPVGLDAGPGRHVADGLGGRFESERRHVGRAVPDARGGSRPGVGAKPGERFGRAREGSNMAVGTGRAGGPTAGDRPPIWERTADRPGACLGTGARHDPGRSTADAGCGEPKGDGSARDWSKARPRRSDIRATHNRGQDRGAAQGHHGVRGRDRRSTPCRWEHRSCARPEDTGPAVDAALGDLGADRHADGPSARSGMGLWDELAQAQSPERTRATGCDGRVGRGRECGMDFGRERDPTTFDLGPAPPSRVEL